MKHGVIVLLIVGLAVGAFPFFQASKSDLGDSSTTEESKTLLLAELDDDKNGLVSIEELKEYVTDTGGLSLDEESEIEDAVANILTVVDDNSDQVILIEDLKKHWANIGHLLNADQVLDWVQHAQQLPEDVVAKFEQHKITGFDFPELIEKDGALLESQLQITAPHIKKRLIQGMKMKLMAMGRPPEKPYSISAKSSSCSRLVITWKGDSRAATLPVHKYVLQKKTTVKLKTSWWGGGKAMPQDTRWQTVYAGLDAHHEEVGLEPRGVYSFRLAAWNIIGRSEYEHFEEQTVESPCDQSGVRLWSVLWLVYTVLERLVQFGLALMAIGATLLRLQSRKATDHPLVRVILGTAERVFAFLRSWGIPLPLLTAPAVIEEEDKPLSRVQSSRRYHPVRIVSDDLAGNPPGTDDNEDEVHDKKCCIVCKVKFTFKERQFRHQCSQCHHYFHKNCGTSNHLPFTACPVQGSCRCNNCSGGTSSPRFSAVLNGSMYGSSTSDAQSDVNKSADEDSASGNRLSSRNFLSRRFSSAKASPKGAD